MNINQNKASTYDLFNKKIIYNFGNGAAYEIDIPQIINDYDEIVIRNNHLLLHRGKGGISISKNETVFENLPPNEPLTSNESKKYTIIYEDESTKLYEVTNSYSYNSPNGGEQKESISYDLYRKEDTCTLEITGSDKNEVLTIENGYIDTGLIDTMEDLFVNFIGAVVFSILGFLYIKNRDKYKFAENFMPSKKTPEEIEESKIAEENYKKSKRKWKNK